MVFGIVAWGCGCWVSLGEYGEGGEKDSWRR